MLSSLSFYNIYIILWSWNQSFNHSVIQTMISDAPSFSSTVPWQPLYRTIQSPKMSCRLIYHYWHSYDLGIQAIFITDAQLGLGPPICTPETLSASCLSSRIYYYPGIIVISRINPQIIHTMITNWSQKSIHRSYRVLSYHFIRTITQHSELLLSRNRSSNDHMILDIPLLLQ